MAQAETAGRALVTGAAGFIGSHLVDRLLASGWSVTAIDNFDPFYDRAIKEANIFEHRLNSRFRLLELDVRQPGALEEADLAGDFDVIVHLAARAGVRPSIADPAGYYETNVRGTQNLLEFARRRGIRRFVFASSSSVYGANPRAPWSEQDLELKPVSPYAASKLSAELLGHVYSHLHGISFIALRFFTVYGPRQRPDLAIHKFARAILAGHPVPVYGDGSTSRDYTYISDIIDGVVAAIARRDLQYEVINLGNSHAVNLLEMIHELENALGIRARLKWRPEQPGDVRHTWADISKAASLLGYQPRVALREGLRRFVQWLAWQQALDLEHLNKALTLSTTMAPSSMT